MLIYADVVFAVNFIMDTIVLLIVSKLGNRGASVFRICLGAFGMSVMYCLLIFIAEYRLYLNIFAAIVIIMLGIIITFKPKSLKSFIKLVGLAHITAFSLGGTATALFYYTNIADIAGNIGNAAINNFSFKLLIISSSIFYIVFKAAYSIYKSKFAKGKLYYRIKIYFEDIDVDINTLVDTGNSLRDPISDNPVIVVEFNSVKDFLPDKVRLSFYEQKELDFTELASCVKDTGLYGRLRMIPYSSLGKPNGILVGFRPDKVEIFEAARTTAYSDVIIGIYNFRLSSSGHYQGLLSPELIHT